MQTVLAAAEVDFTQYVNVLYVPYIEEWYKANDLTAWAPPVAGIVSQVSRLVSHPQISYEIRE